MRLSPANKPRAFLDLGIESPHPQVTRQLKPNAPGRSMAVGNPRSQDAAADFLDDDAVVLLAVAVTDAGLQHVGVNFQERQLLAGLARLVEHELRVLERLPHAALRREIAADHFWSFGVHDLRGRGRAAGDVEERRRIEPEAGGKDQTFGERQAVEAEDEIDRELGAAAIADLADVKTLGEQRVEHRRGIGRDFWVAANQADAVTLTDLFARSRDRRFQK